MIRNNLAYACHVMEQLNPDAPARRLPAALLLDTIARGVVVVNADGILTFINKYAAEALHVQWEQVIGKRVDMLPYDLPASPRTAGAGTGRKTHRGNSWEEPLKPA